MLLLLLLPLILVVLLIQLLRGEGRQRRTPVSFPLTLFLLQPGGPRRPFAAKVKRFKPPLTRLVLLNPFTNQ